MFVHGYKVSMTLFTIHLADNLGGIDDISEIKQVIMKNMHLVDALSKPTRSV